MKRNGSLRRTALPVSITPPETVGIDISAEFYGHFSTYGGLVLKHAG